LIRHASRRVTLAVRTLPVAMIEPALQTPLMAAVSSAALPAPRFRAASRTAIALSAVAVRANPEHRLASLAATNPRPENHFSMNRHWPTEAAFDNSNGSCEGGTSFDGLPSHEGCQARTPLLPTAGFFTAFQSHNTSFRWNVLDADDWRMIAPSARMTSLAPSTPAKNSDNYVFWRPATLHDGPGDLNGKIPSPAAKKKTI
jgi:hypothetical protein